MEYKVDGWNNFCRVFELPEKYPSGFCFNGGKLVSFQLIDWFSPVEGLGTPAISKEDWKIKVGPIEEKIINYDEWAIKLTDWLKEKVYLKEGRTYLVICDFGATLLFNKSGLIEDTSND